MYQRCQPCSQRMFETGVQYRLQTYWNYTSLEACSLWQSIAAVATQSTEMQNAERKAGVRVVDQGHHPSSCARRKTDQDLLRWPLRRCKWRGGPRGQRQPVTLDPPQPPCVTDAACRILDDTLPCSLVVTRILDRSELVVFRCTAVATKERLALAIRELPLDPVPMIGMPRKVKEFTSCRLGLTPTLGDHQLSLFHLLENVTRVLPFLVLSPG
ncbi:hypothetical protein POX_a01476 [Penicillium oxalicum]|nr:hypothetical protein POX_a01476 [Penicillium oxalicum]KAI2794875.1 hypothetical protein POX_a01476 [Penicillium oxalicum]